MLLFTRKGRQPARQRMLASKLQALKTGDKLRTVLSLAGAVLRRGLELAVSVRPNGTQSTGH
jgi:hypothetical protein